MKVIDEKLLAEFRSPGSCEWCGKSFPGLDPHHIYSKGAGRLDVRDNLVSLCRYCHTGAHNCDPSRDQLLMIAAKREKTTAQEITEKVWRLRRDDRCKIWEVS